MHTHAERERERRAHIHTNTHTQINIYISQVARVEPIDMAGGQMDFSWNEGGLPMALFTFLYVDLLDTTGEVSQKSGRAEFTRKRL
jgi:xanthine/uracil/vitamin C permease (AzgA family)